MGSSQRRAVAWTLLRIVFTSAALTVVYFVVPLDSRVDARTAALLTLGLLFTVGMLGWQTRAVVRAARPVLRAAEALTTSFTLFVLIFAVTYYLLNKGGSDVFTEPITRLDSLYFVVTVFGTVGFGDIAARSETARAIVTIQILGDILFVGVAVRAVVEAMRRGLAQAHGPHQDSPLLGRPDDTAPPTSPEA
ncbi:MAG TPA: potassium channel family protein [Actinocrinis sp.]|nr:potassium channel family protein [Actinocrinis sp.]